MKKEFQQNHLKIFNSTTVGVFVTSVFIIILIFSVINSRWNNRYVPKNVMYAGCGGCSCSDFAEFWIGVGDWLKKLFEEIGEGCDSGGSSSGSSSNYDSYKYIFIGDSNSSSYQFHYYNNNTMIATVIMHLRSRYRSYNKPLYSDMEGIASIWNYNIITMDPQPELKNIMDYWIINVQPSGGGCMQCWGLDLVSARMEYFFSTPSGIFSKLSRYIDVNKPIPNCIQQTCPTTTYRIWNRGIVMGIHDLYNNDGYQPWRWEYAYGVKRNNNSPYVLDENSMVYTSFAKYSDYDSRSKKQYAYSLFNSTIWDKCMTDLP